MVVPNREELFEWVASELASERANLEVRHQKLLKELGHKLKAEKLRGPASALEALRMCTLEPSEATKGEDEPGDKSGESNNPLPEPTKPMPSLPADEKPVFKPSSLPVEEPEMDQVVAAEAEMEAHEQEKSVAKKAKKERSELSNTLRRKTQRGAELFTQGFIYRLAVHPVFELTFAICILAHAVLMAAELQYNGLDVGYRISYNHFTMPASQVMPGALLAFEILEWTFGILFMVEATLKLIGLRCAYFKEVWNWFDFLLVLLWIADRALENLPFDTSLLRLLRLARLLRLVKLARMVQGFDALVVMTTSLYGSVHALIWVAVLLILVQMTFALFISQILLFYIEDDSFDMADRQSVFEYFGNFTRSMLSMFEITLGNWPPIARLLQEKVSSWFVIFSLLHKIIFGFACVAVINGVFMQETFKVAQQDDQIMLRTVETKRQAHRKKMQMFFAHANDDDDCVLSPEEWREVLAEDKVKHWFAAQGLSISDPDLLWDILDTSGDRELDLEELIQGTARLQGPAKSLDLAVLKMEHKNTMGAVKEIRKSVDMLRHQVSLLVRNSMDFAVTFDA